MAIGAPVLHAPGLPEHPERYLHATDFFDIDHPSVRAFVAEAIGDATNTRDARVVNFGR